MTRLILMSSGRVPTIVMTLSTQPLLDEIEREEQLLDARDVEALCVVRRVVVEMGNLRLTLDEELVVVQVSIVDGDAVVAARVFGFRHLLPGEQRFVEFFAVPRPDHADRIVPSEYLEQRPRQIADS